MRSPCLTKWIVRVIFSLAPLITLGQKGPRVLAFYSNYPDAAHISFVKDALVWFEEKAKQHHFRFQATRDWNLLNPDTLATCSLLLFLDSRPDSAVQRGAFEKYMEGGGAWMGFHFAGFSLTPSDFPENWDWYHEQFLGTGAYLSNTWRPTSATLRVEDKRHPATRGLPDTFRSQPNEWYRWKNDLRLKKEIHLLLSIDSSSFPLGTGPKPYEIWHSGYYPVVWTNVRYRMVYFNMGHDDIDYDHREQAVLSHSFGNPIQDRLIVNTLLWLIRGKKNTGKQRSR